MGIRVPTSVITVGLSSGSKVWLEECIGLSLLFLL